MKICVLFVALFMIVTALSISGCRDIPDLIDSTGVIFIVEIQTNETDQNEIIDRAIRVTESKIRAIGLKGEVKRLTEADDRIEVKIYGEYDLERLRRFLFSTYRLELKALVSPPTPTPAQVFSNRIKAEAAAKAGQQVLPYTERETDRHQFVIVEKDAIVTGEHIQEADAVSRTGDDSDYQISFTLNKEGAAKMERWTARNINNYLAVVLDDQVRSVAYIRSVISDAGEISGRFTKESAEELAISLNSGYLPATMTIIEEQPFE